MKRINFSKLFNGMILDHAEMNSDKYKNSCLKLKSEVERAVLKSKQTRVVYKDNQHLRIVHSYACFLSITLAVLVNHRVGRLYK